MRTAAVAGGWKGNCQSAGQCSKADAADVGGSRVAWYDRNFFIT